MAYDRYDRDERSRWHDDRSERAWRGQDNRGGRDDRGFWDRASDEVASWFGDDDAERRRERDRVRDEREGGYRDSEHGRDHSAFGRGWGDSGRDYDRGYGRDYDRDRASFRSEERERDQHRDRGVFNRGGSSERDYNRGWRSDFSGSGDRDFERGRSGERSYRPMAGDYGRSSDRESGGYDRSQSRYGRDEYRRTSFAGSRADS